MSEYRCPEWIEELFADDPGHGRILALAWVDELDLKIGDKVYLPEVGWREKTELREQ